MGEGTGEERKGRGGDRRERKRKEEKEFLTISQNSSRSGTRIPMTSTS